MLVAVSTGGAILYVVGLYLVLLVVPAAITWLKGLKLLFFAGLLLAGMVWWIAACRLARPASWWARRFYGPAKLERATARYRDA